MADNEPQNNPEQQNPGHTDENHEVNAPDIFQDHLLRGLGNPQELSTEEAPSVLSDDDLLNDRLSIFFNEPDDNSQEKPDNWLNNFWNSDVSDKDKRTTDDDSPNTETFHLPDAETPPQVMDDFLYEEWRRLSEKSNVRPNSVDKTSSPSFFAELDAEIGQQNALPAPHEVAFLEDSELTPLPETEGSIFTVPGTRSVDALVEMRSLIEEDPTENPETLSGAEKNNKKNKGGAKLNRLEIVLILFIILLTLLTAGMAIKTFYFPNTQSENPNNSLPLPDITTNIAPDPTELEMTGGWTFVLQKSTFIQDQWKPTGPEWLVGAEVRRIVVLPWSAQIEAIVHSLKVDDPITLKFSNQTSLKYKIQKAEQVAVTDAELMNSTTPSLVIILYGQASPNRWVITCIPD
jgi:hypothetical protein